MNVNLVTKIKCLFNTGYIIKKETYNESITFYAHKVVTIKLNDIKIECKNNKTKYIIMNVLELTVHNINGKHIILKYNVTPTITQSLQFTESELYNTICGLVKDYKFMKKRWLRLSSVRISCALKMLELYQTTNYSRRKNERKEISHKTRQEVWNSMEKIPGFTDEFRLDPLGSVICLKAYAVNYKPHLPTNKIAKSLQAECEHIFSHSHGGPDTIENLIYLNANANYYKNDLPLILCITPEIFDRLIQSIVTPKYIKSFFPFYKKSISYDDIISLKL